MSEFENPDPERDGSNGQPLGYLVAASIREYSRRRTLKKIAIVALAIVIAEFFFRIITGAEVGIFVSGIAYYFLFYYVIRSILWWFRNRSSDGTVLGWFRDRSSAS
jgi:hypothetical protein